MRRVLVISAMVLIGLAWATPTPAAQIAGKVTQVQGETLYITPSPGVTLHEGDRVEVFVDLPGVGEAQVATATVARVLVKSVSAKVLQATGQVAPGQQVRMTTGGQTPPGWSSRVSVGDLVVAIRAAQLKESDRVVGTMNRGIFARVQAVKEELLWVEPGARGWVDRKDVATLDQAIPYFTEQIRQNPNDHDAYRARANAWRNKGQSDNALKDLDEAIRLHPTEAAYYNDRGLIWSSKGEFDKAIADFGDAIRLRPSYVQYHNRGLALRHKGENGRAIADFDESVRLSPKYAPAYSDRGLAYGNMGEYDRAIADFNEAIRLNSVFSAPYAALAHLQASCPDDRYRDGTKALENAKQACEHSGWKIADALDALAAAYAENGDFEKARQYELKAIELLKGGKAKKRYRARLELYQQDRPYRAPPAKK
jgi:Flp pilus assembly protein TadD